MGSSMSRQSGRKSGTLSPQEPPQPPEPVTKAVVVDGPDYLRPYRDPKAKDDNLTFPLDDRPLATVSDDELFAIFSAAPRVHHYGREKVVRVSRSLVIKSGLRVATSEAPNMIFASKSLHLPIPKVHRTFTAMVPNLSGSKHVNANFIVMDYIPGPTVEECWDSADETLRGSIAGQVAEVINTMQSETLDSLPPGPLGRDPDEQFQGPWFTDYGAGPFATLRELEDWCNHKVDVCIRVRQLPADTPHFHFEDVVFTHQDIALRNMILDATGKVWLLDWGCAGVYPRGFEQAVLREQSGNDEFADMVLARLSDPQEEMTRQYAGIAYGLSTGRHL